MLYAPRHPPLYRLWQGNLLHQPVSQLLLDLGDHVPRVRDAAQVHDLERVERVALPGRIDLGVHDAEPDRAEVAADSGEQLALIGDVDHDLQPFACGGEARLDYGLVRVGSVVQQSRMPGDLLRVVAQEIRHVEMAPQRILDRVRKAVEPQQAPRLVLLALDVLVRLDLSALQQILRRAKQVLQELAFPGVPHLGARAADIRDREQVESHQPALRADGAGEAPHHFGIRQVLLLRHRRHGEMVLDEELDELCVFRLEAVRAAETPGLEPAQLRMIAPAALGDVVKDRRDVKQPVALEAGDEAAAPRIFVRKLSRIAEGSRSKRSGGHASSNSPTRLNRSLSVRVSDFLTGKIWVPRFWSSMVLSCVTAFAVRKYACISCSPARWWAVAE